MTFPQPAPARLPIGKPNSDGNSLAAKVARIDIEDPEEVAEGDFELQENYGPESVDGELEWILRGKEEDLDKIEAVLQQALEKAKAATHVGSLTGLPRSAFPRIIGTK